MTTRALDKLLNGEKLTRVALFEVAPSDVYERDWQRKLIYRMIREGAVRAFGSGHFRTYFASDLEKVRHFRRLVSEPDSSVKMHGRGNVFQMTPDLLAFLDGLLLGDGHYSKINSGGMCSALNVGQCEARVQWLYRIQERLSKHGINSDISKQTKRESVISKTGKKVKGGVSYLLRTKTYRTFKEQRLRWYPDGKKIIPTDMDLSDPAALAQWYMGDGCAYPPQKMVHLSVCCFSDEEVLLLSGRLLRQTGIRSSLCRSHGYPTLQIYGRHAQRFLDVVRPHIHECFLYKLPLLWSPSKCSVCGSDIQNRKTNAKYCDGCAPPDCKKHRLARAFAGAVPNEIPQ